MIKVSVPSDQPELLKAASRFLNECADLAGNTKIDDPVIVKDEPGSNHDDIEDAVIGSENATTIGGETHSLEGSQKTGDDDGEVDSEGRPWDKRIDGSGKTFLKRANALGAEGTWKPRRKPDDMTDEQWIAYRNEVKAELVDRPELPEDLNPLDTTQNEEEPNAKEAFGGGQSASNELTQELEQGSQNATMNQNVVQHTAESLRERIKAAAQNPDIGIKDAMDTLKSLGIANIPDIANHMDKFEELDAQLSLFGI